MPMAEEDIVSKVLSYLTQCIPAFGEAKVVDQAVVKFPRAVTHFFPGENIFSI